MPADRRPSVAAIAGADSLPGEDKFTTLAPQQRSAIMSPQHATRPHPFSLAPDVTAAGSEIRPDSTLPGRSEAPAARPETLAGRTEARLHSVIQIPNSAPEAQSEPPRQDFTHHTQGMRTSVRSGNETSTPAFAWRAAEPAPAHGREEISRASFDRALRRADIRNLRSVEHHVQRADAKPAVNSAYAGIDFAAARPAASGLTGTSASPGPDLTGLQTAVTDQLGARLVSMATAGKSVAKLQLKPAELGALEIRISMQDDGAVVSIHAQQPHAREAIEAGLPRLREMFATTGTGLVEVDVSGDSGSGADARTGPADVPGYTQETVTATVSDESQAHTAASRPRTDRLLDLWV
jgi:flagellar hook-length control protein FliK